MVEAGMARAEAEVWSVSSLVRAIADTLTGRFSSVRVSGEISGFTRAASGHCYFSLKDEGGQLRCAMFRRAAGSLAFVPRDGMRVVVGARLGVYEPRGELQLVVETLRQAGEGNLYAQFLQRKAQLEQEGLFAPERKRALPPTPRSIGVVTSLGAAALHDVATALQRRAPHIPVLLSPASVQGEGAAAELVQALERLYAQAEVDVILLVRGGGSLEDLWSFNDETLVRTIARSPVPVLSGVGHETDFTLADFAADLRAPTPTAAAELVAVPRDALLERCAGLESRLREGMLRRLDRQAQRLDRITNRLGRPSGWSNNQRLRLEALAHALRQSARAAWQKQSIRLQAMQPALAAGQVRALQGLQARLAHTALRLHLLDPALVLARGYSWLTLDNGATLSRAQDAQTGVKVHAVLAEGTVDMQVLCSKSN